MGDLQKQKGSNSNVRQTISNEDYSKWQKQ